MGVEQRTGPGNPERTPGVEVVLDPRVLARDNLAMRVVNLGSILEGGEFDPDWYATQRAEVLQVGYPGNYRLRDGHHRTAAAATYQDLHPEYEFVCNDVTGFVTAKKYPGQQVLTPEQWVMEVSDPSRIHAEHRFRRVAAVMWTEWNRALGDEAQEFTALSAIRLLGRPSFMIRNLNLANTARALHNTDNRLFGGETSREQRERFAKGLESMADLVISTKFGYDEIAWGSQEVATGFYEDIGQDERERQIRGLVMLPHIYDKVFSSTKGNLLERKRELGDALVAKYQIEGEDVNEEVVQDRIRQINRLLATNIGNYEELLDKIEGKKRVKPVGSTPPRPPTPSPARRYGGGFREPLRPLDPDPNARLKALSLVAALRLLDPTKATPETRRAIVEAIQAANAFLAGRKQSDARGASTSDLEQNGTFSSVFGCHISAPPETVRLMEGLYTESRRIQATGEVVPLYVKRNPREIYLSRWADYAACKDDPDAMEVDGAAQNEAKNICTGCPVRTSCLGDEIKHSRDEQVFVRGGMTARERHAIIDHDKPEAEAIVREVGAARSFHERLLPGVMRQMSRPDGRR